MVVITTVLMPLSRIKGGKSEADKSAVGAINRPLRDVGDSSSTAIGVSIVAKSSEADKSVVGKIDWPVRLVGASLSSSIGVSMERVCCLPGSSVTLML